MIANLSHLLSTLVLHRLSLLINGAAAAQRHAFIAATLHVLAPAGLFLSSPNSESGFSLLSFLGYWLYVIGSKLRTLTGDTSIILSGVLFGAATTFRSNGILNGIIFAADLCALGPLGLWNDPRYAIALVMGGIFNALGSVLPQFIAYQQYCRTNDLSPRPWCTSLVPSVYTFVQEHYWNVGFLRYWTLSNLPLFILALPMLAWMLYSAFIPLRQVLDRAATPDKKKGAEDEKFAAKIWIRLALPQLALTVLAITNFHVQIITRIASGYVLPYVMLASIMIDGSWVHQPLSHIRSVWVVRWMVMYATIQGGLYASFLPPA